MSNFEDIYSLRKGFNIIGLTGRTGSGCTKFAELLSEDNIEDLNKTSYLRKPEDFDSYQSFLDKRNNNQIKINDNFRRKYKIVYDFITYDGRWQNYDVIKYKDVLLLLILTEFNDLGSITEVIDKLYYDKDLNSDINSKHKQKIKSKIKAFYVSHKEILNELVKIKNYRDKENGIEDVREIFSSIYFNQADNKYKTILEEFDDLLKGDNNENYFLRTLFLHRTACYLRGSSGSGYSIYTIVELINLIIKISRKKESGKEPCHIIIDSLRNSLEIMYLKERYAAFYMVSVKGTRRKSRLVRRIKKNCGFKDLRSAALAEKLLSLDETEYKTEDFGRGDLSSPDVENCIAQSDIHVFNADESDIISKSKTNKQKFEKYIEEYFSEDNGNTNDLGRGFNSFFSLLEQAMKLQALIQQPGIIGPSLIEYCMQLAYSSRLNSGCISRQVGAIVTDNRYSVKAIGWNEAASGATPCKLRDVTKLVNFKNESDSFEYREFSDFEKGVALEEYDNEEEHLIKSKDSLDFKNYLNDAYGSIEKKGKPCSFCFKKTYNEFKGDKNQVHTRSLHAEENAMLQISKYGGQALKGGFLFTTASPCELCAKKAYQLGISTIYYIDPYPGISKSHILKSNPDKNPEMVFFIGALGRAFHQLYEPFMPYKDEMLTENKISFKKEDSKFTENVAKSISKHLDFNDMKKEVELKKELDVILEKYRKD